MKILLPYALSHEKTSSYDNLHMCPELLSSPWHSCTEVRASHRFLCTLTQSHQGWVRPCSLSFPQCSCWIITSQSKCLHTEDWAGKIYLRSEKLPGVCSREPTPRFPSLTFGLILSIISRKRFFLYHFPCCYSLYPDINGLWDTRLGTLFLKEAFCSPDFFSFLLCFILLSCISFGEVLVVWTHVWCCWKIGHFCVLGREREKAFVSCLARGSGRLISSHQWNFTVQYRKAEGWKQLGKAGTGGKGCEPVCAAALSEQPEVLDAGERWLGSRSTGRQTRQMRG